VESDSSLSSPPADETNLSAQTWKILRSSTGTPSSSAMTVTGNGYARSDIRSIRPFLITLSIKWFATSSIRLSSLAIAIGVKADAITPRNILWYGGSDLSRLGREKAICLLSSCSCLPLWGLGIGGFEEKWV
jgi:hypothetical protein